MRSPIDDRILAEIRASSILIADYTLHRHGVYYETGFAQGLGLPIIWTCRKDDINSLHFDVRQWPMLDWEIPAELEAKVRDRIRALYPPPS